MDKLAKKGDKVYYHKKLNAYFTNLTASKDNRIYDMDVLAPRKVNKGATWYCPVFYYDWVTDWIPSGLSKASNLKQLTPSEMKVFKNLYS